MNDRKFIYNKAVKKLDEELDCTSIISSIRILKVLSQLIFDDSQRALIVFNK